MPTVQIEAQVSDKDILTAVEKLPPQEFQRFVNNILALRAQKSTHTLPADEAGLLQRINQKLPEDLVKRYQPLLAKRRQATLSQEEHDELLRLSEAVENHEAARVTALADLAQLRKLTLGALMDELGIRAPGNG